MASPTHLNRIIQELQAIQNYRVLQEMASPSNVSAQNPHRPLLESVRTDILHFDEEKRQRIIYNITTYLHEHTADDPELNSVLERILEVVRTFKQSQTLLFSPKKTVPPSAPAHNSTPSAPVRRSLLQIFDEIAQEKS